MQRGATMDGHGQHTEDLITAGSRDSDDVLREANLCACSGSG